jgi:2-isopropylmalate synthase
LPNEPRVLLQSHELKSDSASGTTSITAQLIVRGEHHTVTGTGNGPIDAFVHAVQEGLKTSIDVVDYAEHAMGQGSEATAVAYVETTDGDGNVLWGVGTDPNIISASFRAVLAAYERHTTA